MQIGNRETLEKARNDLRDAFDAVWINSESAGPTERRAIRCALALDAPRVSPAGYCWQIHPWGRSVGPDPVIYV